MRENLQKFDYLDKKVVNNLLNIIKTDKGLAKFIRGTYMMSILTGHESYINITKEACLLASKKGLPIEEIGNFRTTDTQSLTIKEASIAASSLKGQGRKVGFLHGYFRALTPAHLLVLVRAGEECDDLFLGLERSWRAIKLKGVQPFNDIHIDRIRENLMVSSTNLAHTVVAIDRIGKTNEAYRRMVKRISPDVYFGTTHETIERRNEKRFRAQNIGAKYIEIETINLSTTELINDQNLQLDINHYPFDS